MSVSAIFGTSMVAIPIPHGTIGEAVKVKTAPNFGPSRLMMIECSSRPQKKATAHHKKTRPRKTQAWDIRRGPTVYPPLPKLPSEWTLVTEDGGGDGATDQSKVSASATASQPLES